MVLIALNNTPYRTSQNCRAFCLAQNPRQFWQAGEPIVSCQEKGRVLIKVIASALLVLISIALIFKLFSFSKVIGLQVSENEFIAGQFRYQFLLILLALITILVVSQ